MTRSNLNSRNPGRGEINGIIRNVDTVNRDMTVMTEGRDKQVDVPVGCKILLNGESVKLRLLQPGDHVHVIFLQRSGGRAASWINAGIDRRHSTSGIQSFVGRKDQT